MDNEAHERLIRSLTTIATERQSATNALSVIRAELSFLRTRAPDALPDQSVELHEQIISAHHLLDVALVTWNAVSNHIHNLTWHIELNLNLKKED